MKSSTFFISDCHLSDNTPELLSLFERFIRNIWGAKALYILGDLFDVWVGDDFSTHASRLVQDALSKLCETGTEIYFIAGNRDFLLGNKFAHQAGCQILPQFHILHTPQKRVLLTHGDLFCTDDEAYLKYRRWARNPFIQFIFKNLPLSTRSRIAAKLRDKSQSYQANIDRVLTDVNLLTVCNLMKKFNVTWLLHGHTHRPKHHQHSFGERIVLGDWHPKDAKIVQLIDETFTILDAHDFVNKPSHQATTQSFSQA